MNILITTGIYPPEIGGPATYTVLMEKELSKSGFNVFVLPFYLVRHLPKIVRHISFFFKILFYGKKVDIFYAQDPVSVGFPTLCAAKILGKPIMIRVAGDYAWEQSINRFGVTDSIGDFQKKSYPIKVSLLQKIQRFSVNHVDRVITPSIYFRDLVRGWVIDKEKIIHIYNGVDFKEVALFKAGIEPKTIISAGRLLSWKGFDTLIRILIKLPDWKLYIAGDGLEMEHLSKISKTLGLSDRVKFLGSLSRDVLLKKMQDCEIFVLNTSFESFSFQVVEAMYCGIPVISTRVGNLSEIIDDGEEGVLVEPNNEEMIIDAIKRIHSDETFKNKIIKNALKKVQLFSIESTVQKTVEVMQEVVNYAKN